MIRKMVEAHQWRRAKELYGFHDIHNSFTKGEGEIYGALGEIVVFDFLSQRNLVEIDGMRDFDLKVNGLKVEVKTKHCTTTPEPNWNCSIPATSTHQTFDYVIFVRVHENLEEAWILGQLSYKDFYDKAFLLKKGEKDGTFTVKADCYNVRIEELRGFR